MRISKRAISILSVTLFFSLLSPLQAKATAPSKFVFTGAGFGHGVGMSQYGARGMAMESATSAAILSHFYPGTSLLPGEDTQLIRVNVGHKQRDASLTIKSESGTVTLVRGRYLIDRPVPESAVVGIFQSAKTLYRFFEALIDGISGLYYPALVRMHSRGDIKAEHAMTSKIISFTMFGMAFIVLAFRLGIGEWLVS